MASNTTNHQHIDPHEETKKNIKKILRNMLSHLEIGHKSSLMHYGCIIQHLSRHSMMLQHTPWFMGWR